jgi:CheY-like chemotaxis protein
MSYAEGMRRTSPFAAGALGQKAPLVLVVDDESTTAEELTTWLLGQGINAVAAASYLEARAVLAAVALDGLIGQLGLRDGSFFALAQELRQQRPAVVIGYADVDVQPPPELDACFVRPVDLDVLGSFLAVRFGRRRSGEHALFNRRHSVPPAVSSSAVRRRR